MDPREQLESLRQLDLTELPPEAAWQAWNRLLSVCCEFLADQENLRVDLEATRAELEATRAERVRDLAPRSHGVGQLRSLRDTLKKVGVSFWSFLHDRTHQLGQPLRWRS